MKMGFPLLSVISSSLAVIFGFAIAGTFFGFFRIIHGDRHVFLTAFFEILLSLVGIACGHVSRSEELGSQDKKLSHLGLILGYISILPACGIILLFIMIVGSGVC